MPGETQPDPIADAVAGLAGIPAGPQLAVALAPLELKVLTGSQVVEVLKARYRQHNQERAQLLAVTAEVMHRNEPDSAASVPSNVWPGEFAADEVRAALVFSRNAAEKLCMFAEDVVRRLPDVQQAFAAGVLDQPRVWVFSSWTCGLSDEHTKAIVAALLPKAHLLTTAQLIHEMQRHAIALDPTWARRRYERALKGRRVVGRRNPEGTANLAGYDLPVDQVAAACARLDRLAKAAKQAGHPDPIDHVRSYLFLGMTDGTFEGLTDPQILARLLGDAKLTQPVPSTEPAQREPTGESPDASPEGSPADDQLTDASSTDASSTADDQADSDDSEDGRSADERCADDSSTGDEPGPDGRGAGPGDSGPGQGGGDPGPGGGGPNRGGAAGRTSGLRLLVGLATLAGANDRPGELIGWGPVHADLARAIAAAPGASWWYVLSGPGGTPLAIGQVRSRPAGAGPRGGGCAGPQVWLQFTPEALAALADQSHPPGWGRVIAEIRGKAETSAGPPNGDARKRLPGAALRRWIQVRDRTCAFPGCRVPAHRADADHSVEHAQGGETIDANLGPGCRHDHRLRHDGGWTISQTSPGQFSWTSRLGHSYDRQPPPDLDDLPEPMPTAGSGDEGDEEHAYPSTEDWRNSTCMEPERPQRPAPPTPPPPVPPEGDPPPF